jgi:hypothetical protein
MGFLRRRRRPQLDLAALDRLSDTIARAVALIEERLAPSEPRQVQTRRAELVIRREPDWREPERREPEPPEPEPEPAPKPPVEPRREARARAPEPQGFVLFVPTSAGYRLTTPNGLVPERGERLRVEDDWYRVVRLGPSPLPGDRRRCAFLELQLATLEE